MSIWLEGTAAVLTAVKASYAALNVDEGETIGAVVWNADGTRWFTGSSRIIQGKADLIGAEHNPNLIIHSTDEFMNTWDWPVLS